MLKLSAVFCCAVILFRCRQKVPAPMPEEALSHEAPSQLPAGVTAGTPSGDSAPENEGSKRGRSVGVSVLFWSSLFLAGTLYAAVALSPKVLAWKTLQRERYNHQVRLVTLEWQTRYLKRVVQAFETDPEFAAEQARIDFDANRPGEERIAVDPSLSLDSRQFEPVFPQQNVSSQWYLIGFDAIASSRQLQRSMLTAAALITILAFTFFQESQIEGLKKLFRTIRDTWLWATSRYRNPTPNG